MKKLKFRAFVDGKMVAISEIKFNKSSGEVEEIAFWLDDELQRLNPIENKVPIMQFTGFKDKNGVELWEGDLVFYESESQGGAIDFSSDLSIVFWEEEAAFKAISLTHPYYIQHDLNKIAHRLNVKGNIYDKKADE